MNIQEKLNEERKELSLKAWLRKNFVFAGAARKLDGMGELKLWQL